jgi:hypothetical protein
MMTPTQKLDKVLDKVRLILDCYEPKVNWNSTERIISAWLYVRNVEFGFRTPLEMIDYDYPRLMVYLDNLYTIAIRKAEKRKSL